MHECQHFGLAPGFAAETDQPEHTGAGLCNHRIARMIREMAEDRRVCVRAATTDEVIQCRNVAQFPAGDNVGELACTCHCLERFRHPRDDMIGP